MVCVLMLLQIVFRSYKGVAAYFSRLCPSCGCEERTFAGDYRKDGGGTLSKGKEGEC